MAKDTYAFNGKRSGGELCYLKGLDFPPYEDVFSMFVLCLLSSPTIVMYRCLWNGTEQRRGSFELTWCIGNNISSACRISVWLYC
jgi:hypothetical protein